MKHWTILFSFSLVSSIPLQHAHKPSLLLCVNFFWIAFFSCSSKVMKKNIFFCSVLLRAYRFFLLVFIVAAALGFLVWFFFTFTHIYTHTHLIRFRMKEKKAQSFMRKIPQGKKSMKFHATYVLLSWQLRHEVKYKKKFLISFKNTKAFSILKLTDLGFFSLTT